MDETGHVRAGAQGVLQPRKGCRTCERPDDSSATNHLNQRDRVCVCVFVCEIGIGCARHMPDMSVSRHTCLLDSMALDTVRHTCAPRRGRAARLARDDALRHPQEHPHDLLRRCLPTAGSLAAGFVALSHSFTLICRTRTHALSHPCRRRRTCTRAQLPVSFAIGYAAEEWEAGRRRRWRRRASLGQLGRA